MQVSFTRPNEVQINGVVQSEPSGPAECIPSASALVIPQVASVAISPPQFFDDGAIDFSDIIVPRLNCTQRVGEASEIFNPGELVLNKTTVVHIPDNKEKNVIGSGPLVFIPIGMKKLQYAEKVQGGGRGLFLNSELEVTSAGGVLNWQEWKASLATPNKKKYFEKYATFLILVEQPKVLLPDAEHQVFTHEIDGKYYTVCLLGTKGTWFSGLAKPLMTQRKMGFLKPGYPTFNFTLTTESKSFANDEGGKNFAHVPVLGNGPKSTPALLSYIREGLGFGS